MKAPYLFLLLSAVILVFKKVSVWVNPWRLRRRLEKQGIRGPRPCFLYGNVPEMQRIQASSIKNTGAENTGFVAHNYTSTLFPYFEQWRKQYGKIQSLFFFILMLVKSLIFFLPHSKKYETNMASSMGFCFIETSISATS